MKPRCSCCGPCRSAVSRPVGSNREVPVDIRLVAATNEDLEAAIARGTFRADLYHRINEFTLRMPEVRQMREDIMLYADFFLDQANRQLDKHIVGFDGEAAAAMVRYDWPGNLRQMKNTVMSATLLCRGDYISCRELPAEIAGVSGAAAVPLRNPAGEEEQIRRALSMAGETSPQAAKLLDIDRKTLLQQIAPLRDRVMRLRVEFFHIPVAQFHTFPHTAGSGASC